MSVNTEAATGGSVSVKIGRGEHCGAQVISVAGDIDLMTAPDLKATIYEVLDSGVRDIILDMSEMDFMDSSGLGVLVSTLRRIRSEGGSICLVCQRESVLKVFSLTGLDKVFTIYSCLDDYRPVS